MGDGQRYPDRDVCLHWHRAFKSNLAIFIMIVLTGLMRPMIEAPGKAVIGDNLPDEKDRELALNVRYFLLNLGEPLAH